MGIITDIRIHPLGILEICTMCHGIKIFRVSLDQSGEPNNFVIPGASVAKKKKAYIV